MTDTKQLENELEREMRLLDDFEHPSMGEDLAARIVSRMNRGNLIRRRLLIIGNLAAAACLILGIFLWFTLPVGRSRNLSASTAASVRQGTDTDIDSKIDTLYYEFDASYGDVSSQSDELDSISNDLDTLHWEINNG